MQFNALVVNGLPAAAVKLLIEWLQLGTAQERRAHAAVWGVIEAVNTYLGTVLFTQAQARFCARLLGGGGGGSTSTTRRDGAAAAVGAAVAAATAAGRSS